MAMTLEDVDDRCREWADYARGGITTTGSTAEGYLRERLDTGFENLDWPEHVVEVERAVLKMYQSRPQYRRIWNAFYLTPGELSSDEIAMRYGLNVKHVAMQLEAGRRFVLRVLTATGR